jgi:hypothetical protein
LGSDITYESNYFLTTLFPSNQLYIMDYNRVVKDLNGLDKEQFLTELSRSFDVELIGNDTGRRLSKNHTVVGESPTDKDELLKFLKSHNFDYYPLRSFKARPAGNKKLQTSYSVKGTL